MLFRSDAVEFVKRCDPCQRATKPQNWDRMPLSINLATQPFEKWGIDFVGPISPTAINSQARYIIVATDYFTKWAAPARLMPGQQQNSYMSK